MKKIVKTLLLGFLLYLPVNLHSQVELAFRENKTPTYYEVIKMYEYLANRYETAKLFEVGTTDSGKPLHLFVISKHGVFTPEEARSKNLNVIFINNGIHPGESNGIDASLQFANELLTGTNRSISYMENCVIAMVPVFNIGGALNRSAYNRANQNGPELHGFRANAQNLDLNRDFVKLDTRNARSMIQLIQSWDPDMFLDTHSTNGADYPYTVTLVLSHHQQLELPQSIFFHEKMIPEIMEKMNESPYKTSHYVNVFRKSPENGFAGFVQYPRYLCGYTTCYHIPSFTIETHMLKPYDKRVLSTKYLFEEILKFVSENGDELKKAKKEAIEITLNREIYPLHWNLDQTKYDEVLFEGYKAKKRISKLTGQEMMYYDRNDKWNAKIPFYNYFEADITATAPGYYIIPSAWKEVTDRLELSNISFKKIKNDTSLFVEVYYIENYDAMEKPYNGHYYHNSIETIKKEETINFFKGDYVIPLNQRGNAYIVQTLEPNSFDSFLKWNFFDAILARQEYFSPYLFENTALDYLKNHPEVAAEYNKKRASDAEFNSDHNAQLQWIYEHSPWSEPTYMRYPVYRYNGVFNN